MSSISIYRIGQTITDKKNKLFAKRFMPVLILSFCVLSVAGLTSVFGAGPGPAVTIDQCANGAIGSTPVRCATKPPLSNATYESGNVNSSKAHWTEGDVLPYRAVLTNLNPGVNTVTFSFDTAKSSESKHAIDYLASFDYTETTGAAAGNHANQNNPCLDAIATCNPAVPTATAPIAVPTDFTTDYPAACANGSFTGTVIPNQAIKGWTASPTGISNMSLSYPDTPIVPTSGDCTAKFKITFTVEAGTSTVVLAWGGHVSANAEWGAGNAIPTGSPYHMHAGFPQESPLGTFFQVGNQDLQLASSAIVPPTTLTVNKVCQPVNDTGKFNLRIDGATAGTGADAACGGTTGAVNVAAGAHTVSELAGTGTNLSDYTAVISGDCAANGNVSLAAGENKVCTITNTRKGHIIVDKVTVPGGHNQSFSFTTTGSNYNGFSLTDAATPNNQTVVPGAYTVAESAVTGWNSDGGVCDQGETPTSLDVGPGETVTCTFTNTLQQAHLTLVKTVTNDNGGTAAATDWTLAASGPTPISGVTGNAAVTNAAVNSGVYNLSENGGPSGYTASTYSCVNNGGQPVVSNTITLAPGDNATCTINNNDNTPSLVLNKIVVNDNGGTAAESAWTLNANGPTALSGAGAVGDSDVASGSDFDAGTYALSETSGPTGYSASDWTCVGGTQDGSNITVGLGQTATCTITNDDIQPKLTLTKIVVNDNGGNAVVSDFPLFVNATGVTSGAQNGFNAGSYSASETNQPGYTAGSWTGDCAANGSITLAPGDVKACTITNDDQPAHVILNKIVINNSGGSAGINDFGLSVGGNPVISGSTTDVNSNTAVALNEAGLSGYSFVSLTGDAKCPNALGGNTANLNEGETITCTITNDDNQSYVIVNKTVVNNNGGSAGPNDFLLTVDGNPVLDEVAYPVDPGIHSAGETSLPGYTAGAWGGDCDINASVSVALGQTKTCTITNDDQQATITLVKVVNNNNGGTAQPDDFDLTLEGSATTSGAPVPVNPGTYTAGETLVSGYSFDGFSGDCDQNGDTTVALGESKTCTLTNSDQPGHLIVHKATDPATDTTTAFSITASGGTIVSPAATQPITGGGSVDYAVHAGTYNVAEADLEGWSETSNTCANVAVALGETKHCTITNTQQGKIIVQKQTNPDGDPQEFHFNASYDQDGFNLSDNGSNDSGYLSPGQYSVTEDVPSGWDFKTVECTGQADPSNIQLAAGQTITCVFTNEKDSNIVIVKQTLPDGDQQSFNFTANYDGDGFSLSDGQSNNSGDIDPSVYSVSETVPSDWNLTSATCSDDSNIQSIGLSAGETVTCTFTNTKNGRIIVDKITDPSDDPQSFDFTTTGAGYSGFSLTDAADPNNQQVVPGAYSVSEGAVAGWNSNGGSCDLGETPASLDVGPGETVTCTFINTKLGHLIVQKTTVPAGETTEFSINATGSGTISGSGAGVVTDTNDKDYEVTPGTYSVAETVPAGWDKTGDTCQNVVVAAGQTAMCLLTNTKRASLTIVKDAQPNDLIDFSFNGGSLGNFLLDDDTGVADAGVSPDIDRDQSRTFANIVSGNYSVSETMPNAFWTFGGVTCVTTGTQTVYDSTTNGTGVSLMLNPGANVTCTFVNTKASPTRTQGFWQTHTAYTSTTFAVHFAGGMQIGSGIHRGLITNIQSSGQSQLFGAYFSNIAKKSDNKQREAVDKARMVLLQQLVTAKLNCAAFGCASSIQTMISTADAAYAAGNASAMKTSTSALDAYNNSGDTITIGNAGKATPTESKTLADLDFWDQP